MRSSAIVICGQSRVLKTCSRALPVQEFRSRQLPKNLCPERCTGLPEASVGHQGSPRHHVGLLSFSRFPGLTAKEIQSNLTLYHQRPA